MDSEHDPSDTETAMRISIRLFELEEMTPGARKTFLSAPTTRAFFQSRFGSQWKAEVLKALLQMKPKKRQQGRGS